MCFFMSRETSITLSSPPHHSIYSQLFISKKQYKVISPMVPTAPVAFRFCDTWSVLPGKDYRLLLSYRFQNHESENKARPFSFLSHKFHEASSKAFPPSPLDSSKPSLALKSGFVSSEKQILHSWSLIKSKSALFSKEETTEITSYWMEKLQVQNARGQKDWSKRQQSLSINFSRLSS